MHSSSAQTAYGYSNRFRADQDGMNADNANPYVYLVDEPTDTRSNKNFVMDIVKQDGFSSWAPSQVYQIFFCAVHACSEETIHLVDVLGW